MPLKIKNSVVSDMQLNKSYGNHQVTMSNALAQASHGLQLNEKRLIALAIRQIDSRKPPGENKQIFRIYAKEMEKNYGIQAKNAYRELKNAGKGLFSRQITFTEGQGKAMSIIDLRWIYKSTYKEGEGWIELGFVDDLMPHLTSLKERFATYKLDQVRALKKSYSWRIMELMMSYKKDRKFNISPTDFMKSVGAPKSYSMGQVRQRIIDPAIKEINKSTSWDVQVHFNKSGRKIANIRFDFQQKNQLDLGL